ncbi:Hypothetical protein NTJ_00047 [Nesidiocoris tenuis]|uniref:Uncharacterized protein n=1 Tax=Nesidiocoris tenuis TaxID=355587 RepID=A0ABN7A7L4_9HEMI|nr:Hypothetical protein NTJ_00047 [Nesidiocoris tenuis]
MALSVFIRGKARKKTLTRRGGENSHLGIAPRTRAMRDVRAREAIERNSFRSFFLYEKPAKIKGNRGEEVGKTELARNSGGEKAFLRSLMELVP